MEDFTRKRVISAIHLSWLLSLILLIAGPAHAAISFNFIDVNSLSDIKQNDGLCTLREAVIAANQNRASGNQPGECATGSRLLVDVIRLTLTGTYALTLSDSGNEDAAQTGDLDLRGNVNIIGQGHPTIIDASHITDRVFQVFAGKVTLERITITGGNVTGDGGGIHNQGLLTLQNSTISGNQAGLSGGGIFNSSHGSVILSFVTIANNRAQQAGGLKNDSGNVDFRDNIIAGNIATASATTSDCSGLFQGQGYNLFGQGTGCPITSTDRTTDPATVFSTVFGALETSGENMGLHALLPGSPAIDGGQPTCPPPAIDQRGLSRPQREFCDIGAFEFQAPLQAGPIFTVNTADDLDDGRCDTDHCSLREAINSANARTNDNSGDTPVDKILFAIPDQPLIQPVSELPAIDEAVIIEGESQSDGPVEIKGDNAGSDAAGLTVNGGGSTVSSLAISFFGSHGIEIASDSNTLRNNLIASNHGDGVQITSGDGNTIQDNWLNLNDGNGVQVVLGNENIIRDNTITSNGADGVRIMEGSGNTLLSNLLSDNGELGIDLGNDEVTVLDPGDGDSGPNNQQNSPVIFKAIPGSSNEVNLQGRLNSNNNTTYQIEFFANESCDASSFGEGTQFLGTSSTTILSDTHDVYFEATFTPNPPVPEGHFITATATDPAGNTSEFSPCVAIGPANDVWTRAMEVQLQEISLRGNTIDHYIDVPGRSRWYKFAIEPNSQVIVKLTNLQADFDLFLYKDIQATFDELTNPQPEDLVRVSAEFAPGAPSPGAPSPGAPSPGAPSPGAPSPGAPSLNAYAPGAPSPGAPSPGAPSPGAPSLYDYAPGAPSPGAPSPGAPSPGAPSFASAETRSFVASSTFDGLVDEVVVANTWNNTGNFYVRVSGDNGAFSVAQPFHLEVTVMTGTCGGVTPTVGTGTIDFPNGDHQTLILTDLARMAAKLEVLDPSSSNFDPQEAEAFQELPDKLEALAAISPQVDGAIVDVNDYVLALNQQADEHPECPYAKNLVAEAIQEAIKTYRADHPLAYIVIIGGDEIIPFFRYPDKTDLGNEMAYLPPVLDNTASQASLRLGFVLGQDAYGSVSDLSLGGSTLPLPDLPVGRLVETPTEINHLLDVFPANGVVPPPQATFISGYDFLEDGARAVSDELAQGLGLDTPLADCLKANDPNQPSCTLIADQNLSPDDPRSWTADQLRQELLSTPYDLIYLAGHFSANSTLAADYSTFMLTTDLLQPGVADMTNAIVFSPGCHSGYNIVDEHGIPFVTSELDWAQAFTRKGATLIAGTGYQYGDTEFIEYSERLYFEFSRQLRLGTGPVSIGHAMVAAKQTYLAGIPFLRGMHEKALLESTIFGLPMLSVNLPHGRLTPPSDDSIVDGHTQPVQGNPFGLEVADVSIALTPPNELKVRVLDVFNIEDGTAATATWLQGRNGIVTNPGEPVLPRHVENVTVHNKVLRGMVFLGGTYQDTLNVVPLLGRPTTELAPVLNSFPTQNFFPTRFWNINYFDALTDGGATRIILMPAQLISSEPGAQTNTRRQYSNVNLKLFYLSDQPDDNIDLVNAPTIVNVLATNDIIFRASVLGDPAVETEKVWVTYTALSGSFFGQWQSLELNQTADARIWEGSLPLGTDDPDPSEIRYIVQACNSAGLCTMETNRGAYYIPGLEINPELTTLVLEPPDPDTAPYGTSATFNATLTISETGQPLANQAVTFGLGPVSRQAQTDSNGQATVSLPLLGFPDLDRDGVLDSFVVQATFGGTVDFAASSDTATFTITKQDTHLEIDQPASGSPHDDSVLTATLTGDIGQPLAEQIVFFIVRESGGAIHHRATGITNYLGHAVLGNVPPPMGTYTVEAYFSGVIPLDIPGEGDLEISDNRYNPSSATGILTLENNPPVARDDTYHFGQPLVITAPGVLRNDADPDGDPLAVADFSQPARGILTMATNGAFSYTPTHPIISTDSFTYTVSDGQGGTDIGQVKLIPSDCLIARVILPNGAQSLWPPNGEFTTAQISATNIAELTVVDIFQDEPVGNAPDGVIVSGNTIELRAERLDEGDGRVYHIFFEATNLQGQQCEGQVQVGVVPPPQAKKLTDIDGGALFDSTETSNSTPLATDDTFSTSEDTQLTVAAPKVLSNDSDVDGDVLRATLVTEPATGKLTFNQNGGFRYMPAPDFNGVEVFVYQASDGTAASTATITITIMPANDAPIATDDQASTGEGARLEVDATNGLLANDSDTEGETLVVTAVNETASVGSSFTLPSGASLTMQADGSYTYDPESAFEGLGEGETATDSFTYTVSDEHGGTDTATVTITITGLEVDAPPLANDDAYEMNEDETLTSPAPGVLDNDDSPDGDTLTAVLITGPTQGALELEAEGGFTYTPTSGFNGTDSFTYQASDGANTSNTATVIITVEPVNGAPEAADDQVSTDKESSLATVTVLDNDTDPEGDSLTVLGFDASTTIGTVVDNGDGTFGYDPNGQFEALAEGETATDSFTYTVGDGNGGEDTATVTITITGFDENAAPAASDDSVSTAEDSPVTLDVAANDTDPDGDLDTTSATVASEPANGAVVKEPEGTFTYTPNSDFAGTDSFGYEICDTAGLCSSATVTIEVTPVDDAPDGQDDAYSMNQGETLDMSVPGVLDNDGDVEGAALTVVAVEGNDGDVGQAISLPSGATLTLNADGSFTFTPLPDFTGEDTFTYTVSDGNSSDTATVIITVVESNP